MASRRNSIFANFAGPSFSTTTPGFNSYFRIARDPPRIARKRNVRFSIVEPYSSGVARAFRSGGMSLRTTVACRPSAVAVLFRNMEGLRISHYRILRRLGSGGMGEVYAAEDERLRRNVAIKFISHDKAADEKARQRFEREARAASALNHPNICTIFEVNEHE